jgi:hypothetical protein
MSAKMTVAYFASGENTFHLYKEMVSEDMKLAVSSGPNIYLDVRLPLAFLSELASRLPAEISPLRELAESSDEKLRAMARRKVEEHLGSPIFHKLVMDQDLLEESIYEDLLASRSRLRSEDGFGQGASAA